MHRAPAPPGFEALEGVRASDCSAVALALALTYSIGPAAASIAVHAGAPCRVAHALSTAITVWLMGEWRDLGASFGIEPWSVHDDPPIYKTSAFEQTDWENLARIAGEPVAMEAWEAHAQSCFKTD